MNRDLKRALALFIISYSIDIIVEISVLFCFNFTFYYWMGWVRLLFAIAYGLAVLLILNHRDRV